MKVCHYGSNRLFCRSIIKISDLYGNLERRNDLSQIYRTDAAWFMTGTLLELYLLLTANRLWSPFPSSFCHIFPFSSKRLTVHRSHYNEMLLIRNEFLCEQKKFFKVERNRHSQRLRVNQYKERNWFREKNFCWLCTIY